MRPTFLLDLELRLHSAITSKSEPHALQVGTGVTFAADYETPWGKLAAGTKAFVSFVDDKDGLTELLVEGADPALYAWDNKLVLVPFDTEDLTDCLAAALRSVVPIRASVTAPQLAAG